MAIELADDAATRACGAMLGALLSPQRSWVVTLAGELGAGKTTLVRGLLGGLGHKGRVRSPTYTLIEPYRLADRDVLHLDLYRLADPGELEYLGLEDLLTPGSIALVEWPERGRGLLPLADIALELSYPPPRRFLGAPAVGQRGERVFRGGAAGASVRRRQAVSNWASF